MYIACTVYGKSLCDKNEYIFNVTIHTKSQLHSFTFFSQFHNDLLYLYNIYFFLAMLGNAIDDIYNRNINNCDK